MSENLTAALKSYLRTRGKHAITFKILKHQYIINIVEKDFWVESTVFKRKATSDNSKPRYLRVQEILIMSLKHLYIDYW